MIRRLSVFLFAIAAMVSGLNLASQAQSQALLTRHVRNVTINGQTPSVGRLPANQTLHIDIVLPIRDQADLDNFLREVYNPSDPSYRHFLTPSEFAGRFGPTQQDYDALIAFLAANHLNVVGGSRESMDVQLSGSVAAIEAAFHVTLRTYHDAAQNRTFFAPDREPTVDLNVRLWHISGLDNYSIPRPLVTPRPQNFRSNAVHGSCPQSSYCGSDMRAAYYGGTALNGSGQNLGLLEFLGYDISDLNTYFTNAHQTNNVPVIGISTDGSSLSCLHSQGCDDTEQILDMTQSISMAPGLTSLYVFVGNSDTVMLSSMATHTPLNFQLSSSWTWQPADPASDDPIFQRFSAQGQNYFQAAGDSGRYTSGSQFVFPADDPFVTTVGGTDLQVTGPGGSWLSETAWVDGGGGFYTVDNFPIPSWQQLPGVITTQNHGSTTLRNAPDVAAESNFDFYVCANQTTCTANEFGGTSFAAPMWAGYMALVNQQAVTNGHSTLGFINPIIYPLSLGSGYAAAFHDITVGSNGWPAVVGYDLATGWGSPNGSGLINALAGSENPDFAISASPTSVTVAQGGHGTSTITTTVSGGFNAAVALSATGQPSGVTVSFNPTSIPAPGAGSSTMTINVSGTTTPGTYPITVTGTGGGVTHTTTVTLTVTPNTSANFAISASPTSVTQSQGKSVTSTITTTVSGGFNSAIALSASGQPAGVTVTFNPSSIPAPGAGSSTMTMAVGLATVPGTYPITVTGTGGGLTHTTTVNLTVTRFVFF